jgi:hypothetical protein
MFSLLLFLTMTILHLKPNNTATLVHYTFQLMQTNYFLNCTLNITA